MFDKIIYAPNISKSGLCDRLIDLMLLSAYARVFNAIIYVDWKNNLNKPVGEKWNLERNEDYHYENYSQYFNLPNNVIINKNPEKVDAVFFEYLGGCLSPYYFHEKFLNDVIPIDIFLNIYFENIKQFTPTPKLLELVSGYTKPKIGVHLRRGDKIDNPGSCGVSSTELNELNKNTCAVIEQFLKNGKCVYLSSDSLIEYNNYMKMYGDYCINKNIVINKHIEKTYIDIYMLSQCEYVVMSQYHSNYSIFSALVNNNNLIYFYEDSTVTHVKYTLSDKFIYYKNYIESNVCSTQN